jgi:hypothetical protein
MNEQELKDMKLHQFTDGKATPHCIIHRVPNGWNYIYYNWDGTCVSAIFVPEISIIQEHSVPRLRSF